MDRSKLDMEALERRLRWEGFCLKRRRDGSWVINSPDNKVICLNNDQELYHYADKYLADKNESWQKNKASMRNEEGDASDVEMEADEEARSILLALAFLGIGVVLVVLVFRYLGFFDQAFFLLTGLVLTAFGLAISIGAPVVGSGLSKRGSPRRKLVDRIGWMGSAIMILGILLSIYSELYL